MTFNISFFPLPPPFGKSVSGRERGKSIRRNRHGFGEYPGQKTAAAAAPSAAGVVWGGGKPAAVSASGLSGGDFGEIFLKKNSDFASQTCTIERSIAIVGKEKLGRAVFHAQLILFAECKHTVVVHFLPYEFFQCEPSNFRPWPLRPPSASSGSTNWYTTSSSSSSSNSNSSDTVCCSNNLRRRIRAALTHGGTGSASRSVGKHAWFSRNFFCTFLPFESIALPHWYSRFSYRLLQDKEFFYSHYAQLARERAVEFLRFEIPC